MPAVLVTGMSGTGKSSALAELARRGHAVVDTDDDGWSAWVEGPDGRERLWREDRIVELLATEHDGVLYLSGCVRNQMRFGDRFAAIVLLSAPASTILERIAERSTNSFGRTPEERARARRVPRVRTLRRVLGLTQEEFAARYQIPLGTLRDWEQGPHGTGSARAGLSQDDRL